MKILVITQYFPPEPGAPSNRLLAFVESMTRRGHKVTVICEFPNYPSGILNPHDKWKFCRIENKYSYRIIRTFVLTFAKKNNIKRMLFYLSFALSSLIMGLLIRRHDVVFASSPPIFHAYTAMVIARIKRSKFVLDIRDLWPDTVIEFEAMSRGTFTKLGGFLERSIYKAAKIISASTEGIKKRIVARGGENKVHVIYNGSHEHILNWNGDIEKFRAEHSWHNKVIILYAGIIGIGQNLPSLIPCFTSYGKEILFQFIGDGPQKSELAELIKREELDNVKFMDTMPFEEVVPYLCSADIMLVILKETKLFEITIPSKFFDCMAAGKPVLTNVDGETRAIMEKYNTGRYFSLKDPGSFKKALDELIESPDKRALLGENGKKLVADKFLRSKLSDKAVNIMEQLMDGNNK